MRDAMNDQANAPAMPVRDETIEDNDLESVAGGAEIFHFNPSVSNGGKITMNGKVIASSDRTPSISPFSQSSSPFGW